MVGYVNNTLSVLLEIDVEPIIVPEDTTKVEGSTSSKDDKESEVCYKIMIHSRV